MARVIPPGGDRQYDWIFEVLTDLRTFSRANGFDGLAAELDDLSLLAAAEISTRLAQDGADRSQQQISSRH